MHTTTETVWRNLPGCVTVSVNGTMIAGAVNIYHEQPDHKPEWRVTPASVRARVQGTATELTTFVANNEEHARDWLLFLADLYIAQPAAA